MQWCIGTSILGRRASQASMRSGQCRAGAMLTSAKLMPSSRCYPQARAACERARPKKCDKMPQPSPNSYHNVPQLQLRAWGGAAFALPSFLF